MFAVRMPWRTPAVGYLIAAFVAMLGLLPMLANLPRVAVIACFESGHPLYLLLPSTQAGHCLSAPAPVVGWSLMIAGTLVVHAVVLPLLLALSAVLARGIGRLAGVLRRVLAVALAPVATAFGPGPDPAPVFVPVHSRDAQYFRANPHRGPPWLD